MVNAVAAANAVQISLIKADAVSNRYSTNSVIKRSACG